MGWLKIGSTTRTGPVFALTSFAVACRKWRFQLRQGRRRCRPIGQNQDQGKESPND